jgi:hypothetical protein
VIEAVATLNAQGGDERIAVQTRAKADRAQLPLEHDNQSTVFLFGVQRLNIAHLPLCRYVKLKAKLASLAVALTLSGAENYRIRQLERRRESVFRKRS